jgi:hypothetical protein
VILQQEGKFLLQDYKYCSRNQEIYSFSRNKVHAARRKSAAGRKIPVAGIKVLQQKAKRIFLQKERNSCNK